MTDEQLFYYLDASHGRLTRKWRESVDAAWMGYVIARSKKAMSEWRRQSARAGPGGKGLTGARLEGAIGALAMTNRDLVALPGQTVRRMRRGTDAAKKSAAREQRRQRMHA